MPLSEEEKKAAIAEKDGAKAVSGAAAPAAAAKGVPKGAAKVAEKDAPKAAVKKEEAAAPAEGDKKKGSTVSSLSSTAALTLYDLLYNGIRYGLNPVRCSSFVDSVSSLSPPPPLLPFLSSRGTLRRRVQ